MSLIEKIDAEIVRLEKERDLFPRWINPEKHDEADAAVKEAYRIREIIISEQKGTCNYTLEDDDANTWECNKCGVEWALEAGTPEDNEMNYCPKCGREIIG